MGAVFAIAVIKHSFGGLGSNWLNPAAGAWLFIRLSWPAAFTTALGSTPEILRFGNLKMDDLPATALDGTVRNFLNGSLFSLVKVELPEGYVDLFVNRLPGIIADRGVFALLLGTVIISAIGVSRGWIPAIYLFVYGLLTSYAGNFPYGGELWSGDVIYALCTGGALAAAFFLVSDPATGPKSQGVMAIVAAAGGILAFLFRFLGSEPYGAVLGAVFINALLPLIRMIENRKIYEKRGACT
jgi:electron transport complex protein RnfD